MPLAAQAMKAADISIDAVSQADIARASIGQAIAFGTGGEGLG
jgi:hypothetical protein